MVIDLDNISDYHAEAAVRMSFDTPTSSVSLLSAGATPYSPPSMDYQPTTDSSSQHRTETVAPLQDTITPVTEHNITSKGPVRVDEQRTVAELDVPEPDTVSGELGDTDEDLPSEPVSLAQIKSQHAKLEHLIAEHQKRLRSPKVMLSDKSAASYILELEYLRAFNNTRFELQLKLQKQKDAIANAPPRIRAAMRSKSQSIQPSVQAAAKVNRVSGKGPYFAKRLCHLSAYLLRTGELPENNRGKGASHESLLNRADVLAGIRLFVTGILPIDEGGYEGPVSVISCLAA